MAQWSETVALLHSERPKLHTILAFQNAIGLGISPLLARASAGAQVRKPRSAFGGSADFSLEAPVFENLKPAVENLEPRFKTQNWFEIFKS